MARKTYGYDRLIYVLSHNWPSRRTGITPRDSDKEMIIQILQFEGAELTEAQMDLMRKFNFESLTRARRKLQEAGEYMPSPEIAKKRRLKGCEVQQTAPKETPMGIHRRIQDNTP
jgi:hypothetical protein